MNLGAYMRGLAVDTAEDFADCRVTLSPPSSGAPGVSPLKPGGVLALYVAEDAPVGQDFVLLANADGIQGAARPGITLDVGGGLHVVAASWKQGAVLRVRLAEALSGPLATGAPATLSGSASIEVPAELLNSKSMPATAAAQDIGWGVSIARGLLPVMPEVGWTIRREGDAGEVVTSTVADVENRGTDVYVWAGKVVRL